MKTTKSIYHHRGFAAYILIILLNILTDLGHKITIQNIIFKTFDPQDLFIYTAIVNALILLPFVLMFSISGFLSDKYAKTQIIRQSALAAIGLTMLITLSYANGWFELAFVMTLLLAAQSAIFSPAKYSIIKPMFGKSGTLKVNAIVQAVTIIGILVSAVVFSMFFEFLLVGVAADTPENILPRLVPLGVVFVILSTLEYFLTFGLPTIGKTSEKLFFNIKKLLKFEYLRQNHQTVAANRQSQNAIVCLAIFWGISQTLVAIFGAHLKANFAIENTVVAQVILGLAGLGIIFGSIVISFCAKERINLAWVVVGVFGVGLSICLLPFLNSLYLLAAAFFFYGVSSALLIAPLNALIQLNTPNIKLGRVLAGSNLYQNISMLLFLVITAWLGFLGLSYMYIFAWLMLASAVLLVISVKKMTNSVEVVNFIIVHLIKIFIRPTVMGLEHLQKDYKGKGVLLLGNHVSFLDWIYLIVSCPRPIKFAIEKHYFQKWYFRWFVQFMGQVPISNTASKQAIEQMKKQLDAGDTVVIFPEGALTRNGLINKILPGFTKVATSANCVIVPFYIHGVWSRRFSMASDKVKQDDGKQKVFVSYGKALDNTINAATLKRQIISLSADVLQCEIAQYRNISNTWLKRMKRKTFIGDTTGVHLNNRIFATAVLSMAHRFKQVCKRQNIGVILPPMTANIIANMALLILGKTAVNLNFTANNMVEAIKLAELETVITSKNFIEKLKDKGFDLTDDLKHVEVVFLEDIKKQISKGLSIFYLLQVFLLPASLLALMYRGKSQLDDTAFILFSSGSEGMPKGIELSHRNIIGNVRQAKYLLNPKKDDVIVGTLPIFHCFGMLATMMLPLLESIPVVYHPDPRAGREIGRLTAKYQATIIFGTSTFFRLYMNDRKLLPAMFSSLRMAVAGAERLQDVVRDGFKSKFGKEVFQGYGMTECAPVVSANSPDMLDTKFWLLHECNRQNSVGKPLIGTEVMIVDPETLESTDEEAGMILVSGVQVMKGYLKNRKATDKVVVKKFGKRWYVTGDKGKMDEDGFVYILDRYSRFAKVGGEMVSLSMLENKFGKILGSETDFCITTIEDDKKGEKIILLYTGELDIRSFKVNCADAKIPSLYVPDACHQVDEIPKLGTGKPDFKTWKQLALTLEADE